MGHFSIGVHSQRITHRPGVMSQGSPVDQGHQQTRVTCQESPVDQELCRVSLKDQCSGFKSHQWIRDRVSEPTCGPGVQLQGLRMHQVPCSSVSCLPRSRVNCYPCVRGSCFQDPLCTKGYMSRITCVQEITCQVSPSVSRDHMTSKVYREYVSRVIFGPGVTCQGSFVDPGVSSVISVLVTQH